MQLAKMYHERRTGLSELLACEDVKAIGKLYGIKGAKLNLLIINTAIPTIFAYGRHHAKEQLCERAYNLLESLKPEENRIIRMWQDCGLEVTTAGDSQALIQLKKEYCDKKNCIRCRFGFEFLAKKR
jgi:galactokinase